MFSGFDLTPDLLAVHGRALRGLARSLLRDAHAAEDVVQETWLACLRQPQAMPERLSAWLGTVASRLALRRKRGDSRRRVREARAAAPERIDALQQRALEREEALRAVTEALLGLEEPFKSALLLHFYEERSAGEIAAELGLPVTTVKSRIARGLELLRARLGTEYADERRLARALLALAGAPELAPVVPAASGATPAAASAATVGALGAMLPAAAAATLLVGGAFLWWQRPAEERPGVVVASQEARGDARAGIVGIPEVQSDAPEGPVEPEPQSQREALATEGEERARPEPFPGERAYLYRISGTVRDERDLPLRDANVFLGPRMLPMNRVAVTDEHGRFALEFEGREATLDCAFSVESPKRGALGLRELRLVAGQELVVDVGLTPADDVTVEIAKEKASVELALSASVRSAKEGAKKVRHAPKEDEPEAVREVATTVWTRLGGRVIRSPLAAPELARRPDGRGVFVDPPPALACARTQTPLENWLGTNGKLMEERMRLLEGAVRLKERRLGLELESAVRLEIPLAEVRGFVRDEAGNPLAGVLIGWGPPGCALGDWVHSDEHGAFELDVLPGDVELRAGGGDHGRASGRATLAAGAEHAWDAVLERGAEVKGRVLSSSGDPLRDQRIELWSVSSASVWCDATRTDEHGRFAVPNVPGGALELLVYEAAPIGAPSSFPVHTLQSVFAGTDVGEIVLDAEVLRTHALSARLLDWRGEPLPGSELRVWHEASGAGRFALEIDTPGEFVLTGLPAGSYRVTAGGPLGWRDLGRVWVDGEDLDLGSERFAAPGALVLEVAETTQAAAPQLSLWSAHAGVFARVATSDELGARPLVLRPGAYLLCADPRRGAPVETRLEVQAETANALALRTEPEARFEADPDAGLADPTLAGELGEMRCASCHGGEARR